MGKAPWQLLKNAVHNGLHVPDFESAVLVAIVTASVFTTTLHAQRIREDSSRTFQIATDLDGRIRQLINGHEAYAEELWDRNNELRVSLSDRRSIPVFTLNLALTVLTIGIAVVSGALQSRPGSLDVPNLWALRSFVLVELLVVGLGGFDWWSVWSERRRKMLSEPGGLVALAEGTLMTAFSRSLRMRSTRLRLHYATSVQRYTKRAIRLARESYPPALALLGMAELVIASIRPEGQSLSPMEYLKAASTQGAKDEVVTTALATAQWQDHRVEAATETLLAAVRADPFAKPVVSTLDLTAVDPRELNSSDRGIRSFPRTIFWEDELWRRAFEGAFGKHEWRVAGDLLFDTALSARGGDSLGTPADRLLSEVEKDGSLGAEEKNALGFEIAAMLQTAAGHDQELRRVASLGVKRLIEQWKALNRAPTRTSVGKRTGNGNQRFP
jgi:hypothetical protein